MSPRKATLIERANISRRLAESHRRLAAQATAVAEKLDHEADLMEAGVDPFEGKWS